MGKNKNAGGGKGDKGGGKGGDKDEGSGMKKDGIEIKVRHILCEKHSKKEEALAQLKAGVSFDEVATKFSEHKAGDGGDLGWKGWGSLLSEFQNVAFELEPSSLKSPVIGEAKTNQGYHIIMVQDRRKATKRK
ncbi:Peptidyl-prolyl cis-trans isomerase pin4 [Cytospora mali]|uniref:Peptidyl-prolyl cis-trans isomerase n=1 Tax=Cytospora mali TaxID=578113 RepID=A0A194V9X6_CYTMA|nr:Peptidyl-prolyl cis-trans isomerase pin4 [Valsa mali var. pyri (nom. inval.)]